MIAAARPWTVARYAAEVYCREKLDLSPGTIENLEIVCRQLDLWNSEQAASREPRKGGKRSAVCPFLTSDFCREALIDWMRWLAESRKLAPATINGKRALPRPTLAAAGNDPQLRLF